MGNGSIYPEEVYIFFFSENRVIDHIQKHFDPSALIYLLYSATQYMCD